MSLNSYSNSFHSSTPNRSNNNNNALLDGLQYQQQQYQHQQQRSDTSTFDRLVQSSTPNSSNRVFNDTTLDTDDSKTEVYIVEDYDELDTTSTSCSKDTDLINTTRSSGAEIVGIYETDPRTSAKESSKLFNVELKEIPYSSKTLDDFGCSIESCHNGCQSCWHRIDGLKKQTKSLEYIIDELKSQLLALSSRLDNLEAVRHQVDGDTNDFLQNNFPPRSISSLNRDRSYLTKQANNFSNCRNSSNVEARKSSPNPTIDRKSQTTNFYQNLRTLTLNNNTLEYEPAYRASTNSLYKDSRKSPSHSQKIASPVHLTPSVNKSTVPYSSMLSLSSLIDVGSTLRKTPALSSCSISNLSLSGGMMKWSSLSDILPNKNSEREVSYDEEERLVRMILYGNLINMRVPTWIENDYNFNRAIEPPPVKLKLDWVNGYRGRDCRSNLYHLPTGECVYFVASIVILLNSTEKTQRHYTGHTDNIKCIAVHPNKLIIASGQSPEYNEREKKPIVRIWNSVNLATLRVINFNEDFAKSICCVAFSKRDGGSTLAVVDESSEHTITLLDWQKDKNWRLVEGNSGPDPVLAIEFHPFDEHKLVAVGKLNIYFWDTRGHVMTKKPGLFDKYDKPKYVQCLTINDMGDTITGDSNGNIIIWPNGEYRPKRAITTAHAGGVFSILAMRDGTYLSGGRDRQIIEWDKDFNRTGRLVELPEHCGGIRFLTHGKGEQVVVGTLRNSILMGSFKSNFCIIMQGHAEALSALVVHPILNQYLTGGYDHQIHLNDCVSHKVLWSKCVMTPATTAAFSPNGLTLIIGSSLGKWLVLDALTQEIIFTKCDGTGVISCIKFSPNCEYVCFGSSDCQIYMYSTTLTGNKFQYLGACVGHTNAIKELDWSDDSRYIQTQSINFELLTWRAANCSLLEDPQVLENLRWSTQNCTLGFGVFGAWSDVDSAIVNSCDKSNNEDLIATVTDSGSIRIYEWPASYSLCLSQRFAAYSDKFNFVKFSSDDSRLIAVVSKSCMTMEWIVQRTD